MEPAIELHPALLRSAQGTPKRQLTPGSVLNQASTGRKNERPELLPTEEAGLVRSARRGGKRAFEGLYARYAPMVHGIVLSRVSRTDSEDLVQDIFLQAYRKLASLRDEGAFGSWVAQIARRRIQDHYRRARPVEELPRNLPGPATTESRTEAMRVLQAIRSLPPAYAETLAMRLVEGLTGPEIAQRTGLTPGSVRVNLSRGMKRLRQQLGMEEMP